MNKIKHISPLRRIALFATLFLFFGAIPFAQTKESSARIIVTGQVLDNTSQSLVGVNIIESGTLNGTVTDQNGHFSIQLEHKNSKLNISYLGYVALTVNASSKPLKIIMKEDAQSLDEVVVVGYGTQKVGNLTTAVSSVKAESIKNRPVQSLSEGIQGQVAGLNVVSSGQPGKPATMQLRGATSLNGGGSPLVLVDGVPGDFNYLNPDDIESIAVLKDAASAAIYGSRAANGVLLVTTKRGKLGKPKFTYNGYFGVNTPTNMPVSVSSAEYARSINLAEQNMGRSPVYSDADIQLYANGTDPNHYPNTNWLNEAITNSFTSRHGVEVSGGTEEVRYLLSTGLDHQTSVFPGNTQDVFNFRSNTDVQVTKKLKISADLRFERRNLDQLPNVNDAYKNLFAVDPTMVARYTNGAYAYNSGFITNPLVGLFEGGNTNAKRNDLLGIFKVEYQLLDGLKFTGIANANYVFADTTAHSNMLHYTDLEGKEYTSGQNSLSEKRDYSEYYNLQALLNYTKKLGKHTLDVLAGYQQESQYSNNIGASRSGYPTDLVWVLNAGPADNWRNSGTASHWALASFFGRINYDYEGKYIATMNIRSDGSSRFAASNRWATFPSVAGAWRISQEKFMKGASSFIDDLKLRASWGETGASTGLGLYPSYSTISMSSVVIDGKYIQTAQLGTIGNPDLKWERTNMLDYGIDLKTLQGRLSFTGDYYIKTTKDILIKIPVPREYGFANPFVNIGSMENRGWELSLTWNDHVNSFNYYVSANLSDNKNKVLDLGGTGPWINGSSYTDVGLPFNSIYGYQSAGLFQSDAEVASAPFQGSNTKAGDVRYVNQNPDEDQKINSKDLVVIGDPYPHYLYGINVGGDYKGFDLSMMFQGIGKKDVIVNDYTVRPFDNNGTIFTNQIDYWTPQNPQARYPRLLNKNDADNNYQVSDYWKYNAGYLRLKTLQLGYSIPSHVIGGMGLNRVRVYFSANNLLTFTNFAPNLDPEASNSLSYPFAKTYAFGLNVQF